MLHKQFTSLLSFQEELVEALTDGVEESLTHGYVGSVHVMHAPTGAGKTVMVAEVMRRIHEQRPNTVFIVASPGRGGLHEQSAGSFDRFLTGAMRIEMLSGSSIGTISELDPGTVYVLNWEKMYLGAATGELLNLLMRDSENGNLRTVLAATTSAGREVVLIIDESHTAADGKNTKAVRDIISPMLSIEMSATPAYIPNRADELERGDRYHRASVADAVAAGLIKKSVLVNPADDIHMAKQRLLQRNMVADDLTVFLDAALRRRERQESLVEGNAPRPLLIVQIPDGTPGDETASWLRVALAEEGITEENGRMAIWLSSEKINVEEIAGPSSGVDVLIFKRAIDTGWDCPRAGILLRLRQSTSDIFETQVLGRILRMPERRHYGNELDFGYVYGADGIDGLIMSMYDDSRVIGSKSAIRSFLLKRPFTLESTRTKRGDQGSLKENEYGKVFMKVMRNAPLDLLVEPKSVTRDVQVGITIAAAEFDGADNVASDKTVAIKQSHARLKEMALKMCASFCGPIPNRARMSSIILNALIGLSNRRYGAKQWAGGKPEDRQPAIYQALLNAEDRLRPIMIEIAETAWAASVRGENTHETIADWSLLPACYVSESGYDIVERSDGVDVKYLYEIAAIRNRKRPEQRFDNWLIADDRLAVLQWWSANISGSRDGFGVPYVNKEGVPSTFYPDRFIMLSNDSLLILEVKDESDPASELTKLKAEALARYIKRHNLRLASGEIEGPEMAGGVVVERYGQWYLHKGDVYDWSATRGDDWSAWTPLDATFEAGAIEVSEVPALTYAS